MMALPKSTHGIVAAIERWKRVLPPGGITIDRITLRRYETATFSTSQEVVAVLHPVRRDEISRILEIANHFKVPVYPVSGGKNWGLGSRVPPMTGCAIIDLGHMNQIVDYSEEYGYITVEPGVTFAGASSYLASRGSKWFLSVIGGPPGASLIGNAVDRGDGVGPLGDRLAHSCALEVILADGRVVHTGFSRFEGAEVANLGRWGLGPSLDGLFSQSNLGIVTQMTFWLRRRPRVFQSFLFTCNDASLEGVLDASRHLMRHNIVEPNSVVLWNRYKAAASEMQFPWELTGGRTPIDHDEIRKLRLSCGPGAWLGIGALYGASWSHAKADRRFLRRNLRPHVRRLMFIDQRRAWLAGGIAKLVDKVTGSRLDFFLDAMFRRSVFLGHPTDASLRSVYWRKRSDIPSAIDPDRDRCGLLTICTALPFSPPHLVRAERIVRDIFAHHGFEPNLAMTFNSERYAVMFPFLLYDRDVEGEDLRARACHDEALKTLTEAGYVPYRLGVQSMESSPRPNDESSSLIREVRASVDPNGILSPRRYE